MTVTRNPMPHWDAALVELLRAVIDRIIPEDQDSGATSAGADLYILAQLQGDAAALDADIRDGLAALAEDTARRHGQPFPQLAWEGQDGMLREVAGLAWFQRLAELTAEGFYADPGNGNRGAVSWRMIGYEHGLPDGPEGPGQGRPDVG